MEGFPNTSKQDSPTGDSLSGLPTTALVVLARIIARAYLADNQGNNAMARTSKKVKKGESLRRTRRSNSDGEGNN